MKTIAFLFLAAVAVILGFRKKLNA